MKLLFLLLSALSFHSKSDGKLILQNTYVIQSDVESADVPHGKCRVYGNTSFANEPIQNAIISTLYRTKIGVTDSLGNYSFYVSSTDTSIFFFKEGHTEIVIWNYKFQDQHAVQINFYGGHDIEMLEVDKPVIYLYSDSLISLSLDIEFNGDITFTYPEKNNGWLIEIGPNGMYERSLDQKMPYLFWEGTSSNIKYAQEDDILLGQLIERSKVVSFLEVELTQLGLNSIEKTDFITFWAPKMIKENFVFIQFLIDEDYDNQIAQLKSSVIPDSQRRIYMLYSAFNQYPEELNFTTQNLPAFERKGFTLIEWGGSKIPASKIEL